MQQLLCLVASGNIPVGPSFQWDAAVALDAEFHQSPVFLAFFNMVREKGMKEALKERARLFGP